MKLELNDLLDAIQTVRYYFRNYCFCTVYQTGDGIVIEYGCGSWSQYRDGIDLTEDYKFNEEVLLDDVKKDVKWYVEKNGLLFDENWGEPGGWVLKGKGFVPLSRIQETKWVISKIRAFLAAFDESAVQDFWGGDDGTYTIRINYEYVNFSNNTIKFNGKIYDLVDELIEDFRFVKEGQVNIKIKSSNILYEPLSNIIANALSAINVVPNISRDTE